MSQLKDPTAGAGQDHGPNAHSVYNDPGNANDQKEVQWVATVDPNTGRPVAGGGGGGGGAITAASGAYASGAIASGAFAAGSVASGAVASGAYAAGSIASGAIASGAIASGAIASGAVASGAVAAGALAAGAGVDGWDLTQGAKADAAWTSGPGSVIALLKALATMLQSGTAGVTQNNNTLTDPVAPNGQGAPSFYSPAPANQDQRSATLIPVEAPGLLNASGTIDRLRGHNGAGVALTTPLGGMTKTQGGVYIRRRAERIFAYSVAVTALTAGTYYSDPFPVDEFDALLLICTLGSAPAGTITGFVAHLQVADGFGPLLGWAYNANTAYTDLPSPMAAITTPNAQGAFLALQFANVGDVARVRVTTTGTSATTGNLDISICGRA